ncbi:chymotrypsin inhibitor, partial [Trichonephila inaurata madagascariensis]
MKTVLTKYSCSVSIHGHFSVVSGENVVDKKLKKEGTLEEPPTETCDEDEEYYECKPNCRNTCSSYNRTDIACPDICEPGCFCKKGMVEDDDGECISPQNANPHLQKTIVFQIPLINAGKEKNTTIVLLVVEAPATHTDCAPSSTVANVFLAAGATRATSSAGTGSVSSRLIARQTRPPSEGKRTPPYVQVGLTEGENDVFLVGKNFVFKASDSCRSNEVYNQCGSACPPTCSDRGENQICTLQCVAGCFCKEGLVRDDEGECVKPEDCLQSTQEPQSPRGPT